MNGHHEDNVRPVSYTHLELKRIERSPLLILDELFLVNLDAKERPILLDIIEDRHGRKSIIITSDVYKRQPLDVKVYPSYLMLHRYELLAISDNLTELGIKRIRRVGHQDVYKRQVQGGGCLQACRYAGD